MAYTETDGWYPDPWRRWPERYFTQGQPTEHVRYGPTMGRDPLPASPPPPPAPGGYEAPFPPPGQPYGSYGYPYGGYSPPTLPKAGSTSTGPLPLHPMAVGDILDGAFRLYRANFKTILIVVLAVSGPLEFASALARRTQNGGNSFFGSLSNQSGTTSTTSAVSIVVTGLISLIALPYAGGAISRVVSTSYMGGVERPGPALRATLGRWWALLAASVLVHLVEVIGFVLLILPGLIFMALYVCVAPAIVIEGLGPIRGMRRSWSLNRHRKWRVLGIALLSGIMVTFIGSVLAGPLQIAAIGVGLRWGWILLFIGSMLGQLVTISLNAIIATLLYFDGRIRQEGFDLQILARRIGG